MLQNSSFFTNNLRSVVVIGLVSFLLVFAFRTEAETNNTQRPLFRINSGNVPPYTSVDADGFENLLARKLLARLGYRSVFNSVPSQRGLQNINNGVDDFILSRIAGLQQWYPNILPIDEVVVEWNFVVFVRDDSNIQINNWGDLKPYNVAYVNGWKIFDKKITHYKSIKKVHLAAQLFKLLETGRIDVAAYAYHPGLHILRKNNITGIKVLSPPLARKKKYFYIHKKHAALEKKFAAELRNMKKDGTYKKLYFQTMPASMK